MGGRRPRKYVHVNVDESISRRAFLSRYSEGSPVVSLGYPEKYLIGIPKGGERLEESTPQRKEENATVVWFTGYTAESASRVNWRLPKPWNLATDAYESRSSECNGGKGDPLKSQMGNELREAASGCNARATEVQTIEGESEMRALVMVFRAWARLLCQISDSDLGSGSESG